MEHEEIMELVDRLVIEAVRAERLSVRIEAAKMMIRDCKNGYLPKTELLAVLGED